MKLQIVSKIFSVIYLFVIFAAEQGGSGLTVFDSCYIPGSLLSLIWSKLMKRRQGQHQPWAEPPLWHGAGWHLEREIITWPSASELTKGIYDAGLLESIGSKLLRKERLLAAGTGELRSYKWNSWGNELLSGVMSPLQDSPHSPGLQCYIYWTLIDPGWRDNLGNFLHHLFHHWFLCN